MKWQDPFLGFLGMRYSYGVSASLRLNCWLQWPHLATKIHRRGLEFTEKARNIHRVRLVFDSSGLSILGTTMFDEHEHFWWIQIDLYIVFHAHVHGVLMNMKWPVTKKFHIVAEFTSVHFVWLVSSSRPSVLGIARELLAEKCEPWAVVILTASHEWEKSQFPVTNKRNILQSRWIKWVFWPAQIIGICEAVLPHCQGVLLASCGVMKAWKCMEWTWFLWRNHAAMIRSHQLEAAVGQEVCQLRIVFFFFFRTFFFDFTIILTLYFHCHFVWSIARAIRYLSPPSLGSEIHYTTDFILACSS